MRRIMIQADEELLERARRRAQQRGVSVAAVVRGALERELGPSPAQPQPSSVGVFDSGAGDLGARASRDEYKPRPSRS